MCYVKLILYNCNHVRVEIAACRYEKHCHQQPTAAFGVHDAVCGKKCTGIAGGNNRYHFHLVPRQEPADHECFRYCKKCLGEFGFEEKRVIKNKVLEDRETDGGPPPTEIEE